MNFFVQIELPVFVIMLFANVSMAVIVLRFAVKDMARLLFALFVFAQIFWILANYLAFHTNDQFFLWAIRSIYFFAVLHSGLFYLFVYNFLKTQKALKCKWMCLFILMGISVAVLALTPWVINGSRINENQELVPTTGMGIAVWILYVVFSIFGGLLTIIKRMRESRGVIRKQWLFLLIGLSLTFLLVIVFSFVNPMFFGNISSARLGHVYTFPFLFFTTYAMVRHHLLNLKTILAESSVILLNFFLIIRLFTSENSAQFFINGFVVFGSLIMSGFVIRGVYREIHQREQLEIVTKQLAEANEKLQDLDRARAEFISIASHQLRTPPATIKWYLAAIQSGDFGQISGEAKDALTKAEMVNNSQIALIDDLLNASRIERGKMEFMFELGDIVSIVQFASEQLWPQAKLKKLDLMFNKPEKPVPLIVMDREKIRQVVNNFIDNAIKYTKQGAVMVEMIQTENDLGVKVTDSGKGFFPDIGDVLFQKYTRGKDSVMHATGLGLGLYVAKVIIEKHNGKIWAESPGVGKGAVFSFTLPIKNSIAPNTASTLDLTVMHNKYK